MQYAGSYSIMYDTWFFMILYYNPEMNQKKLKVPFNRNGNDLSGFNSINLRISRLPKFLLPFFYMQNGHNPLTRFFLNFDSSDFCIEKAINIINSHSDMLYDTLIQSYFPEFEARTGKKFNFFITDADCIEALNNAPISDDVKLQLCLLLSDFDNVRSVLNEKIIYIYTQLQNLYLQKSAEIDAAFNRIKSKAFVQSIQQEFCNSNIDDIANSDVIISLLNTQCLSFSHISEDQHRLVIGINCTTNINDQSKQQIVMNFMSACGCELRIKMLQAILIHGEMTLSDFAHYTDLSAPTVIHHLRAMFDANVLKISRYEGKYIYYKINSEYITYAMDEVNAFFEKLTMLE